jgi:hypothetical protein
MDISSKYKIVEKIIQSNDDELLNEINSLLNLSENDFWDDLPSEIKEGINEAKSQLADGQGIPHAQIMADVKARFFGNK